MAMSEINSMPPKWWGKAHKLAKSPNGLSKVIGHEKTPRIWESVKLETCKKMLVLEWNGWQHKKEKCTLHKTTN
jgi:hypothetical protein